MGRTTNNEERNDQMENFIKRKFIKLINVVKHTGYDAHTDLENAIIKYLSSPEIDVDGVVLFR